MSGPSACWTQVMFADQPGTLSVCRLVVAMKHIGVKVDPVRPRDCASRRIDGHLGKVDRFSQLLKDAFIEGTLKVNVSDQPVREGQPKTEVSQVLDLRNPGQRRHQHILLKTIDPKKGLRDLRPFPIGDKFSVS